MKYTATNIRGRLVTFTRPGKAKAGEPSRVELAFEYTTHREASEAFFSDQPGNGKRLLPNPRS